MKAAWRRRCALAACVVVASCERQPNPRNEIGAIAEAALTEVQRTAPGQALCVDRTIAPWRAATEAHRRDPPPPPGYEPLYSGSVFRGGGGLKGAAVGGVTVRGGVGCLDLRGPLVSGEHAMIEVHQAATGLNLWLQRTGGDWRVVMTTTSVYR